jgi:hypothetical protein
MAASHTSRTILASTVNGQGSSTTGTEVDNTAGYGLLVCAKCTNAGTGPNDPCQMNVYIGESSGTKRLFQVLMFDLGNNVVSERASLVPPEAMYVNVTFTGNSVQQVTVECYGQHLTGV